MVINLDTLQSLLNTQCNFSEAARRLGVSRTHIYDMLNRAIPNWKRLRVRKRPRAKRLCKVCGRLLVKPIGRQQYHRACLGISDKRRWHDAYLKRVQRAQALKDPTRRLRPRQR